MQKSPETGITRDASLAWPIRMFLLVLTIVGIGTVVFYLFNFSFRGYTLLDRAYYYLLFACFLSSVFLVLPASRKYRAVRWYDFLASVMTLGISVYFFIQARRIMDVGWTSPPPQNFILALILVILVLEAGRRAAGNIYVGVCVVVGLYPLFAQYMPGVFYGFSYPFVGTVAAYAFGSEGLLGIPTKVTGDILIAYLVFAGFLMEAGAGRFFINLALALLGGFRGGPAKVSVLASCLFGTLSGSAIANVISTGVFTIPTMKRIGYSPHYAGAVEACASTGGMLMPPVMGAVAFVMAAFLGVPYAVVVVAAIIPAVLYYVGLLLQVDAHAAKLGLRGLPRQELPSIRKTLAGGWPFLVVIVFLTWGLLYMRWEAMAAFYGAGLMFLLSFYRKETMMTPRRVLDAIISTGRLIVQTMAVMLPVGLIVGGLVMTGTAAAFAAGVVRLGAENIYLILLMGVAACYIMGMAGLITPAYIFLAVSFAPAAIKVGGLDPLAVHLFIVYYSCLGAFTPPVATAAFVAASMAGASPIKTAFTAMRLGVVIYFIPVFFVFSPALILRGNLWSTPYLVLLCVVGIILIAASLEGYLFRIGKLATWSRPALGVAGFLIAFPNWQTAAAGAALAAVIVAVLLLSRVREVAKVAS